MIAFEWLPIAAPLVVGALVVRTAVGVRRARAALHAAASATAPPGAPCTTDHGPGYQLVVAGRRACIAVAATLSGATYVVDIDADVPADDLRRRRAALGDASTRMQGVRHVAIVGDRVRVFVRASVTPLDDAARAVDLVIAMERAGDRIDGEGPPGGAPIAVRASGG